MTRETIAKFVDAFLADEARVGRLRRGETVNSPLTHTQNI